jgi:hypothetical protein
MFKSVKLGGRGTAQVRVVGHFKGGKVEGHAGDAGLNEALKRGEATGDVGRIVEAFAGGRGKAETRVLIVGLGEKGVRRGAGLLAWVCDEFKGKARRRARSA